MLYFFVINKALGTVGIFTLFHSRTGRYADRSADQSYISEAHSAVVDLQVPHTTYIRLLGYMAAWKGEI